MHLVTNAGLYFSVVGGGLHPNSYSNYFSAMDIHTLITIDPDIMGGQPVFTGTRVPIETLFDHLEAGISLNEFLDDFPTVSKAQAIAALETATKLLTSTNVAQLYVAAT